MYRKKSRFWESFSKGMKSFGQTCTHYFFSCMLSPRHTACICIAVVVLKPLLRKHKQLNMGRRPSLSTKDRCQALGMLVAGESSRQVASVFWVIQSTMSRLLQLFNTTQSVNDRRYSGRPRSKT